MNINQLPPELILCIGDNLRRAPLNALVQTSKRHATILTPLLYHKAFRRHFRPAEDDEPEPRVRSLWVYSRGRSYVSQRRLWACVPCWKSEYVMRYFLNRSLEWAKTRFGGREKNGATWLHLLAAVGHEKLLSIFMEKGLDVNSRDWAENTVLHSAAAAGQTRTIDILINAGADILTVNQSNQSVLVYALMKLKLGALIHIIDIVRAKGGDINSNTDSSGIPPIFLAMNLSEALPVVKHFLDNGVNVFQTVAPRNDTLLHWAARLRQEDIGNFLVSKMKSRPEFLSLSCNAGWTPLHFALTNSLWSFSKSLICAGADLEKHDGTNRPAMDCAISNRCFPLLKDIFERLPSTAKPKAIATIQRNLWTSIKEKDPTTVFHLIDLQSSCKIKLQLPTLHFLIERHQNLVSDVDIFEIIGDAGADFHLLSKTQDETPLHAAIRHSAPPAKGFDRIISYLLLKTTDFTLLARGGNSILHHAAKYGSPKTVELVLKHPGTTAEIFALENRAGNTALHEAVKKSGNNKQVVKLLMQAREEFHQRSMREKISARSPRKIGKPAVPDPPVRGERKETPGPEVLGNRSTNVRRSNVNGSGTGNGNGNGNGKGNGNKDGTMGSSMSKLRSSRWSFPGR